METERQESLGRRAETHIYFRCRQHDFRGQSSAGLGNPGGRVTHGNDGGFITSMITLTAQDISLLSCWLSLPLVNPLRFTYFFEKRKKEVSGFLFLFFTKHLHSFDARSMG